MDVTITSTYTFANVSFDDAQLIVRALNVLDGDDSAAIKDQGEAELLERPLRALKGAIVQAQVMLGDRLPKRITVDEMHEKVRRRQDLDAAYRKGVHDLMGTLEQDPNWTTIKQHGHASLIEGHADALIRECNAPD